MVAINSALEVDLTGQVCSDSIGPKPYSGVGGQVDFMRGAARSKGGKPIIALPSTAKNGTVSRIVPTLTPGAGVVTSRADVHYVVTEHGVAYLHGKTVRQRAEALIAIADPKFQEELERSAFQAHHLAAGVALAGIGRSYERRRKPIAGNWSSIPKSAKAAACAWRPARPESCSVTERSESLRLSSGEVPRHRAAPGAGSVSWSVRSRAPFAVLCAS